MWVTIVVVSISAMLFLLSGGLLYADWRRAEQSKDDR